MVYQQEDWGKEVVCGGKELAYDQGIQVAEKHRSKAYFIDAQPPPREPTILGMRRVTFILAVALMMAVIAAGVAGGIGGSLASQCSKKNAVASIQTGNSTAISATITITQTLTATPTTPTATATGGTTTSGTGLVVPTAMLALDCPNLDSDGQQTIEAAGKSWNFTPICGTDYGGFDIIGIISYSFHDCMQACAMYNYNNGLDLCVVVHFAADMVNAIADNGANCWLKNGTAKNPDRDQGNTVVSGLLASSD